MYVTVIDRNGMPVSDLAPTDFTVKEAGKEREIGEGDAGDGAHAVGADGRRAAPRRWRRAERHVRVHEAGCSRRRRLRVIAIGLAQQDDR